ncbi:MAG: alanine--tRNA ligase, partial [Acidimicrobiia bacterium]|nr:alanine--tRNA ligase [Acidimicrobiia bacterium]
VQFKPYLLGEEPAPYPRAVSVQKCLRMVDIDIVGTTARHGSFFEMMGNFSFGDYFKEKAIPWAYEFVTEGLGFDPDRLWFTVHLDDDEAAEIWLDGVGIDPDRLQRRDRDNFWQMGTAGPAGPSSEIFYDKGPEYGEDGGPIVDEERFTEVWNLVFMQYVQDEPYHVVGELPATGIDTGAGLDRLAMVLQGVDSLFEIDLVRPVLAAAEAGTGVTYGDDERSDVGLRILADHGRGLTFLIGDGVVPSNEGRGYVLRRLLRRAVRHAWQLGSSDSITPRLVDATIDVMGDAYPALPIARDGIVEMAEREERRFRRTLESGYSLLDDALDDLPDGGTLSGSVAFKLHDTYGFPVELTDEIAAERGMVLDRAEFDAEMQQQRERARAAWKTTTGVEEAAQVYRDLYDSSGPTEFIGYERVEGPGRVLSIVRDGEPVQEAETGHEVELYVDRTPFYAEAGGQVGDTGWVTTETGRARVVDTQHAIQGLNGHRAKVVEGTIHAGQDATLEVDAGRREKIRKSHTGTHILHWALREVLGTHVRQAGSLVEDGRLRFDFSHFSGLDPDELGEVERVANERVIENARVTTQVMTREEAEDAGALAFFGDKYGDRVRVVDAGGYSVELCGGTHVPTTGQIGPLIVRGESSIGSNLRRVEAYTGGTGYEYLTELRRRLRETADVLRTPPDQLEDAARTLVGRLKDQEERIAAFEAQTRADVAGGLLEAAEEAGEYSLVVADAGTMAPDELRALALQVRERLGSGIAVIGGSRDGKAGLVAAATKDAVQAGVSAGDLLQGVARIVGGGGSRDPELAQAGGPKGDLLADALDEARRVFGEALREA